ncbi:molecular chaperone [Burkholderia thailandensis]|uniref:fimbrial biogenesis chaperone n=1 Tax=Burkholderia thailandensis TaxID=57975 RepID=UPI00016A652E|nr:molecular chaperone [Burkholderia thailandensis]AIP63948.2 pilus assembly protein PapD [Burkholderia thailandensis]AOI52620.1 pilus assembly protein PapD [Burkholderia thailandensis]AOJ56088.1 pilus assembly protein PapD [Burkholderia thailandensis]KXF59904.1 pilus assembly protein PapD [Burkholderia thailandensis]MCS3390310.1 molecular chaperone [Burkholderia thailandensis]
MTTSVRRWLAALAIAGAVAPASGATLQISPVTVEMAAGNPAAGVTLSNPGARPIYGQVRTFRWTQEHGDDVLAHAPELVASPPLLQIGGQSEQLVRLVRLAHGKPTREESYRVLIDELPTPDAPVVNGIAIRLRYSIPVFVAPDAALGPPKLAWSVVRGATGWFLRVTNGGERHAQLASVRLVDDAGKTYEIAPGLLGYALAGSMRQWPLRLDAAHVRKVRATINTRPVEADVSPP